ncbi:MAG: class II aldolase/adducin family protein [Deltaproteobacteria bacterium]|nr:class II aldolase/adducin family protein [Deltaproteobacteria bacterium]
MTQNRKKLISDLIQTAHEAGAKRLVNASSGNISVRYDENSFLISGSGTSLDKLKEKEISTCFINTVRHYEGVKPSMENHFHRAIYKNRTDVNAVLHFQSVYATTLACMPEPEYDLNFIPESTVYIKRVSVIPYLMPGSTKLSEAVGKALEKTDLFVLKNHGQIAVGYSLEDVLKKALVFEFACHILYLADKEIVRYSVIDIEELIKNYG